MESYIDNFETTFGGLPSGNMNLINEDLLDKTNPNLFMNFRTRACWKEENIYNHLKNLKNAKAPGLDNICNDLLKIVSKELSPIFDILFKIFFKFNRIPHLFKLAIIIPIYKKKRIQKRN